MQNDYCRNITWDDISRKESHPGKALKKHIEEVKEFIRYLLNYYEINDSLAVSIADYLAEYHDMGKLYTNWNVHSDKKPSHSDKSVLWIYCNQKWFKRNHYTPLLLYLIYKHHSILRKFLRNPHLPEEVQYILRNDILKHYIKKTSFEERIKMLDVYGFFKIADIVSGASEKLEIKNLSLSEKNIRDLLGKNLDIERWREQMSLINMPDITLLRAYTGWGKTTSSLLFFLNKDIKKVFYLMPTITAINNLYDRLEKVFKNLVSKYYYFYDVELLEEQERLNNLFYIRNFIPYPINITTVDQILSIFLQMGRYYIKRPTLRKAGLIIDEVHLLTPLMLELLLYMLNKYKDIYGMKILFMSATFPNGLVEYILKRLDLAERNFLDYSQGYRKRRRILYKLVGDDITNSIDKVITEFNNGKKVLVVLNTVDRAIEYATRLENVIGRDKIILIHSRYTYYDRRYKERAISRYNSSNASHILVSTQVCEVSLDISYDYLFSEISPIASLIQRFGRVNRRGRYTDKVNTYIYDVEADSVRYPYAREDLETARVILENFSDVKLKNEYNLLQELNEVYTYEYIERIIKKEKYRFNISAFERLLKYFYSADLREEEIQRIFQYRDSFTTLIIPSPDNFVEEEIRMKLNSLIEKMDKVSELSREERERVFTELKGFAIPIPYYYVYRVLQEDLYHKHGFPIISLSDFEYDSFYGLRKVKGGVVL